jgi:hypothetical protein
MAASGARARAAFLWRERQALAFRWIEGAFPAETSGYGTVSRLEEKGPILRQDGRRGRPARRRVPALENSIAQNAGTGQQRRETAVQRHPEQKLEPDGIVPA